ncbi:MAG: YbaK/EbsC family protein [Desulfurococcaceae archaeon]|nr:YbaK/EbsC family protein [Desulfurococcaceae archaeon]
MGLLMNPKEEIYRNIKEFKLRAQMLEFTDTVETVSKACKLSGEPPNVIVKTLLMRVEDNDYIILIVRGDRRVDNIKLSRYLGSTAKLVAPDEVLRVLGVPAGAVSPLLSNVLRFRRLLDPKILEKEYVVCGGGDLNTLVRIVTEDLINYLKPEIVDVFK